jgi:hypothetical protein
MPAGLLGLISIIGSPGTSHTSWTMTGSLAPRKHHLGADGAITYPNLPTRSMHCWSATPAGPKQRTTPSSDARNAEGIAGGTPRESKRAAKR